MNNPQWTGKRLETFVFNETTIEHLHRYGIAQQLCVGKIVLDIASGEGYGSNLLANYANFVYGVDIDEDTVKLAIDKYKRKNLIFKTGSCTAIPLEDSSVDVVTSFETIEHHAEHDMMLKEIKRILKPNGLVLISSPDKKNYTDVPGHHNPYHIKELYYNEFQDLMRGYFKNCDFYLQKMMMGSVIIPTTVREGYIGYSGDYSNINADTDFKGVYNLCIAGNGNIPALTVSTFIDQTVLQQTIDSTIKRVQGSVSFRLGNLIISPFSLFKNWLR